MLLYNYKKKKGLTIDSIINSYSNSEFKSPYRSTIPLIVLVKDNFELILEILDLKSIDNITFEHTTPVKHGRGHPSYSDLLVESGNNAIIIEAKRTEPQYQAVFKWFDDSHNKRLVINGWLDYINNYCKTNITVADVMKIPYQMIHRIASACVLERSNISVLYLGFNLSTRMKNYYTEKLAIMADLTNNKIDLKLGEVSIHLKSTQLNYEKLWNTGSRDLVKQVKDGISNNSLLSFEYYKINKINK